MKTYLFLLLAMNVSTLCLPVPVFGSRLATTCGNSNGTLTLDSEDGYWKYNGVKYIYSQIMKNYDDKDILALDGSNDGLDKQWNLGETNWHQPSYYIQHVKIYDNVTHDLTVEDYVLCHNTILPPGRTLKGSRE